MRPVIAPQRGKVCGVERERETDLAVAWKIQNYRNFSIKKNLYK